ncbi:induced myeloid leukemia cell differentiation protein Mcl-1b [Melanotaenia boesemani]|uniref:induced myeloid leukemia cell differentiation protein Mcl-1b n=1 Tax=Melanotaenia boesemani TaxID=1250792 RepID=UPI001C049C0C|nr:induced myeloid leukemia cell differentiation protein Mcl-1b [Melanotaenia boesemani]
MSLMSSRACGCLIVPQNGVADGEFFRSMYRTTQVAMGSTTDSQNRNVTSSDGQKRPKKLEVTSLNGYPSKDFREHSEDVEDGSLPCTPESHSDSEINVSGGHAGDEVVENDTRQLISSCYRDLTGLSKPRWNESKELATMKRVIRDVLEKHKFAYNGMINKLSLSTKDDDMTCIGEVARSLFADGSTNWGRIASLVAFGAVVCQHLKANGRENCVELVSQEISSYLLTDQRDWLVKNNSWDGFVDFFRVADPETTVRNTLMAVAGVAGIGATLALLIR